MGLFGTTGALLEVFWRPFGPFGDHLAYPEPFLDLLTTIWAYPGGNFHLPGDVGPVWGVLDNIWVSAGGKIPPFRLLAN